MVAAINPYEDQRRQISESMGALVIYVKCALDVLIERDTKGLSKRALLVAAHPEKLHNLSGINDRYDVPVSPDLAVETGLENVEVVARRIFDFVSASLKPS